VTVPIAHGYPDWNRWQATADAVWINDPLRVTSVPVTYLADFVGNQPGLFVWANPTVGSIKIELKWYADMAATILIDTYTIDCYITGLVRQPVPILGPVVQVTVTPGIALPAHYTLLMVTQPQRGAFSLGAAGGAELSANAVAIGAGATQTIDTADVHEGPAVWFAYMTGGTWFANLHAIDYLNAFHTIDHVDQNIGPGASRAVFLPPSVVRLSITNQTAAGQTYWAFLSRKRSGD
jgi:hypothetical protein